ncbi:superoxide dismutase family protein [Actinomadura alba]|uniref:superoxide dismutase family protein n=1 Tax=Actinomadura alba TaxID=406431 RepID=UPI0031D87B14
MRPNAIVALLATTAVTLGVSGWAPGEPSPPSGTTPATVPTPGAPLDEDNAPPDLTPAPEQNIAPGQNPSPAATPTASAVPTPSRVAQVAFTSATFEKYQRNADAITYKPELLPAGADATVLSTSRPEGRTTVLLTVQGLRPGQKYGAHVHEKSCGPRGEDAGPHFQNVPDPKQPSVNPAYANPRNEIWLDFTTDKAGNATAVSTVPWRFTDRHPRSIVVHSQHTQTHAGHAGAAGERLGCVNVDF